MKALPVKKRPSRKTLIKMIALQMEVLWGEVRYLNRMRAKNMLWHGVHVSWIHPENVDVFLPDLTDVASCRNLFNPSKRASNRMWEYAREMEALVSREGVDDSVVREAWNVFLIQEVMDS